MSSFPSFRLRLSNIAMLVAGIALFASNNQAFCVLIPTANGSVVSTGSSTSLTGSTPLNINAGTVNASSGLYDANAVLYLTNTNAATQTVTAQYTVNGSVTGTPFTIVLPANGVTTANQTVALPTQMNLTPGNNTLGVRVINTTGGAGVSVSGSSVAVTGYVDNGTTNTAVGPGAKQLTSAFSGGGGAVGPLTVTVPASSSAQGLYSLNTSLTLNNTLGANQTVTARYTVDGTPTGSTFTVTLPGNGTSVLNLPTQLSGLGTGSHQIGITLGGAAGTVSVATGSSLYATSYNSTGGVNSVTGATAANQNTGLQIIPGGGALDVVAVTVPTPTNTPTFWDAVASISVLNNIGATAVTAQFAINGTGVGPIYNLTLPANGVSTISVPTQFASLTPGSSLSLQLQSPSPGFPTININVEADTISLIAHNQNPQVSAPEPASMSLAAMAAMAFGAAAYRRRKQGKLEA